MNGPYIPLSPVTFTHLFLSFFNRRKKYRLVNPEEKGGVLITVFNEGEDIKETLSAVLKQTRPPHLVIVSEHGSTDNSAQCIEDYLWANGYKTVQNFQSKNFEKVLLYRNTTKPMLLFAISDKRMSKAQGINALKEEGFLDHTDWIVTIDSDTILSPNFLEELWKNMYKMYVVKRKMVIIQNTILGAVVMPKKNKKAKPVEKLIAKAREAEYAFGQILVRSGQNFTALYVAPGCGFMCRTDKYHFPNKTVTEDLELTQTVQSNSKKFEITKHKIMEFGKELNKFQVGITTSRNKEIYTPFDQFVYSFRRRRKGRKIVFKYNRAYFVKDAMMFTQEPHNLKSLATQLDRWTRGFHQTMALKHKQFRKKKRLAWTVYGARYEGLASSLIYLGMPLFVIMYLLTGFGLKPEYFFGFLTADSMIQYTLISIATYKRFRIQDRSKRFHTQNRSKIFFKTIKTSALSMLPWYVLRGVNSFEFLKTFIGTIIDTKIKKIQDWSASTVWERPKEIH